MASRPPPSDDFGEDEPTIIDGEHDTPVELPRCTECGAIVFFDDFTEPARAMGGGLFMDRQCVRARDGHWWYCASFSKDRGKFVYLVPR